MLKSENTVRFNIRSKIEPSLRLPKSKNTTRVNWRLAP